MRYETQNIEDYRYAFQGMEQDNEVSGNGNSYTTQFRQYDPRLGRWKSLDPMMRKYPSMSPYVAYNNNPIYFVDPLGLEGTNTDKGTKPESKGKTKNLWRRMTNKNVRLAFKEAKKNGGEVKVWKGKDKKIYAAVIKKGTTEGTGLDSDGVDNVGGVAVVAKVFRPASKDRKSFWNTFKNSPNASFDTGFKRSLNNVINFLKNIDPNVRADRKNNSDANDNKLEDEGKLLDDDDIWTGPDIDDWLPYPEYPSKKGLTIVTADTVVKKNTIVWGEVFDYDSVVIENYMIEKRTDPYSELPDTIHKFSKCSFYPKGSLNKKDTTIINIYQ